MEISLLPFDRLIDIYIYIYFPKNTHAVRLFSTSRPGGDSTRVALLRIPGSVNDRINFSTRRSGREEGEGGRGSVIN